MSGGGLTAPFRGRGWGGSSYSHSRKKKEVTWRVTPSGLLNRESNYSDFGEEVRRPPFSPLPRGPSGTPAAYGPAQAIPWTLNFVPGLSLFPYGTPLGPRL